ncbi:hypothetical protein U1Q18_021622 [Sarracenia purpurea var. burkii]
MVVCSTDGKEGTGACSGGEGFGLLIATLVVKGAAVLIKDMALKMSGTYRQCKKGQRPFPDFDTISEGVPYPYCQPGSSSSTPAWDFTSTGHQLTGGPDSRFNRAVSGDRTPGGLDSISARFGEVVLEEEDEPKEWMAQVEPGVQITFVSLPNGGNDLKRIRFRYNDC